MNDTYKTIAFASEEVLLKEKNSKFFGYAFPITCENDVKKQLDALRKQHYNAIHFCYAFQTGTDPIYYRFNDDGEPKNSAGAPIYGQIQSFGLTNVLVVVVRYFGGIKLGVGGLIVAYKTAAQSALEASEIIEKTINIHYEISFDYKNINKVMRIIKENKLEIIAQNSTENYNIEIAIRKKNAHQIVSTLNNLFEIELKLLH